ncbi:hypothetical protein SAMN05216251_13138 [Actinacidiphila alni]|uniref:Uncharacterized protein n=1 Tax=Actinacidiphila alni TaxID=380248 RepID=A0A1I2LVU0_9ACTN|nr:hypothetical protein [Actinacidiphila alni]SFF83385.1 hypothetical protein SAMN05216251_13138 [Actinacidiphila alni]
MIRKFLTGAALLTAATAATVGAGGVASAATDGPQAGTTTSTEDATMAAQAGYGSDTDYGTGTSGFSSTTGPTNNATQNGDVSIAGDPHGVLNTYGAPLVNVDLRCAVPATQGVGGNVLGGPVAACDDAPVHQFDGPESIL